MEEQNTQKGIFDVMTPQQTFVFGLVGGVLVLCTLGFFILLGIMLKGGDSLPKNNNVNTGNNVVENNNLPQPSAEIVIKDVDTKKDHIRGNKNAKITIVEFSDTECPFCKRFHETMKQIIDKYGDDVRWVYRQMPLDGLHKKARTEALATECAADQGKFWEYIDLIYGRTTSNDGLDSAQLPLFAKEVGINVNKFQTCLDNKQFASEVQADEADGQAAGGQGTPYSVLIGPNGEKSAINGAYPYEQVEQMIQQYLK
ncbi:MAG: thioredoxin domain-containing protein [Candidatus Magasanikbacteria bacterium]